MAVGPGGGHVVVHDPPVAAGGFPVAPLVGVLHQVQGQVLGAAVGGGGLLVCLQGRTHLLLVVRPVGQHPRLLGNFPQGGIRLVGGPVGQAAGVGQGVGTGLT